MASFMNEELTTPLPQLRQPRKPRPVLPAPIPRGRQEARSSMESSTSRIAHQTSSNLWTTANWHYSPHEANTSSTHTTLSLPELSQVRNW